MKDVIFLVCFPLSVLVGVLFARSSRRLRDSVFIAMVFCTTFVHMQTIKQDINFLSREWYRGTTRGFEFSFEDGLALILLFGTLLASRRDNVRKYFVPGLALLLTYFAYCILNVAISDPKIFGMFELSKILRGIIIFLAVAFHVRGEREIRLLLYGLAGAICFEASVGLFDRYYLGINRVSATMGHPNNLSMFCLLATPILLAAALSSAAPRLRALYGIATLLGAGCVILTISRTGFAALVLTCGLTLVTCIGFKFTPRNIAILAIATLAALGMVGKAWNSLSVRYGESTLEHEYMGDETEGRGYYLRVAAMIAQEEVLGVGLNNYSWAVSRDYGHRLGVPYIPYISTRVPPPVEIIRGKTMLTQLQAAPAHNLFALTVSELGIPGLLIFLALWARWFQMGGRFIWRHGESLLDRFGIGAFFGLLALLLQNLTEWAFRQTAVFFLAHIIIAALAAAYYYRFVRPPVPHALLRALLLRRQQALRAASNESRSEGPVPPPPPPVGPRSRRRA